MKKVFKTMAFTLLGLMLSVNLMADVAPVNTVLWGENFAHFGTKTPSAAGTGTGTTIYGGASITYGQSSDNTKGYNENSAGGTAPELLLSKSNQTWTISGIKSGAAKKISLTFLSNRTAFSLTCSSDAYTVSGSQKSWTLTLAEGKTAPETFNLTLKNTASKDNARIDNVELKVTEKGEAGGCTSTLTTPEVVATPGDKQIVLTWDAVTDATGYKIFKNTAEVGTTTNTTYTLTGLTNKTSYAWQVVAIGNGTTICDSEPASGNATPNTIYTLNYSIAGVAGSVNAMDGSNIVASLPSSPASCSLESNVFQGWTTAGSVLADGSDFTPISGTVDATAATKTYTAVWAKEIIGEEESIAGGDMSNGAPDAWSKYGVDKYSNNGVKFDDANDSIASPDLSKNNAKSVTVKMKAGHNGGSGSVFTISAWSQSGKLIDSKTCTPTDAYTDQKTLYTYTLSGSDVIAKVSVKLTSKTKNMGMKYCEVFAKEVTCSKYITYCCEEHNVTLTNNGTKTGGSFSADIVKACEGTKITLSYDEATGYEFKGWTITPNTVEINENNEFYMPNENVTIDASFDLIPYSITYEKDGGAWVDESQVAKTYTYGTGATLPTAENITKANNEFLGWFLNNTGEEPTIAISTTETGDKSFTARWLASGSKKVTINGDDKLTYATFKPTTVDKEAVDLTIEYSIEKGSTISAVAVTVDGSELTSDEVEFSDEMLYILPTEGFTGDVTIAFTIVDKMFTVTWMANKTQFKQEQIQEGSKVTLPTGTLPSDVVVSAEETYKFQGWIAAPQYSSETEAPTYIKDNDIEPTGDVTYYAVYAMKESSVVENSYVKGTKTDLTEGQKVVIVEYTDKEALNSTTYSTKYLTATQVSPSNNKLTVTNNALIWTVSLENGKYIFKQGNNYLNSTGNNLYCDGDKDTWTIEDIATNSGNYTLYSTQAEMYLEYYSDGSGSSKFYEFTTYKPSSLDTKYYMNFYIPETKETIKNYRTRVAIIDHIEVKGTPKETNFVAGETFDAIGLSIDVHYQGEDNPTNVTTGFTYDPTGALKTTDENITFTYQGKTADVAISVSNTVSKIEVTTDPTKMEYTEGQQFDPAGMVVTATYDNSAERDVTGYDYEPKGDLALGDEIEISFGGQKTNLEITINEAQKTTVNWFVEGVKLTEGGQSTAVIPGKKITVLPTEPNACQGNQFMGWTTKETYYNATTAPTDLFKTLAEAPTIGETETNFYAVFAQVTSTPVAESTVYTSNIDNTILSDKVNIGGNADNQVVAKKLGSGDTPASSLSFSVPTGTTTITLHAVAWKESSNATIQMTTQKTGVVITPTDAQTVNANNGATSSSPYKITPADGDFYTFTLSGVTEETTIKVANTGARVVLWGINTATTITSDYSTTCLPALTAPTIITAEGEYCGSVDVEITQPNTNPEGSKIMYSTDNETWSEYKNAVKLEASGTIYAKVVKDPKQTEVVSATYTVYPAYTLAQAATAASATSQIACLTFTDLLVQARSLNEAFLKASDGQIVLLNKSSHGLSVGDKLVANDAHVTFVKAHDLLQLTSMDGIEKNGTGTPVADVKTITEITSANYGQLVKIMNVTYDATNKKFTDASSNEIAIDAKFFVGGSLPSWPDGGKFNATGVVVLDNNSNAVIAPRNTDDLESLATPLPTPTNFAVASVNSYRASYTWTAVENNAGYTLYIYDGDNEIYKSSKIGSTIETYAPQKDLEAGHTYTAKLVALGDKASYADSPAAETTVTTNPNAKLNWYVGGSFYQSTDASQEKVVTPDDPTSPCPTNYENFVTWYTEEIVSETGQLTALDAAKKVKAGDAAASQAGSAKEYNFYAVFGKIKTQGTDKYVKVTEAQDNWKGEYLIGYDEENDEATSIKVFDGSLTTLDAANNNQTVSFEEDGSIKVTDAINGYRFIFTKSATTKDSEGNDAVYYNIQSASGYYIGGTSGKDNGILSSTTTKYDNEVNWDATYNQGVEILNNRYLCFNNNSGQMRFRYMSIDAGNLILYKRTTTNPTYNGYITTCPQTYTITIAENAKGTVTAATMTEILKGAKVLLTAEAAAGYTKTGGAWVVKNTNTKDVVEGLVGPTNYLTMPAYDVTIDYNFIAKTDNFIDNLHGNDTKTAQGGGTEYVIPELEDKTEGTACDAYYIFDGWVTEQIFSDAPAQNDDMKVNPTYAEGNTYYALWMGEDGFITDCCNTPIPENLKALSTYLKATSAKLDWDNVTDATKYHIIVKQGETTLYDTDVEKSEFEITSGLTKETAYDVYVKAYAGCWSENAHIQFTTAAEIKSYSVTINAEGGTYSITPELVSGKIQEGEIVVVSDITVTDPEHYFFKELTIEPEVTDLTEDEGEYMFTMPSKAITINIVFAEYPKVTWKMEGAADQTSIAVRNGDKFEVGTIQSAPADWKYKTYFPEFAGWVTNDDVENPEFVTTTTEVPVEGLVVNGAVATNATKQYQLVTDVANLAAGDELVIVGLKTSNSQYYAAGDITDNHNYLDAIEIAAPENNMITIESEDVLVFTLGGTTDAWTFKANDKYLASSSAEANLWNGDYKTWKLANSSTANMVVMTSVQYTSGKFEFNMGSPRFRNYKGTQEGLYFYRYSSSIYDNLTINPQPDYGRNDLVVGNYGMVCVPYAVKVADRSGATFWNIETSNAPGYAAPTSVTIVEETNELVAGKPYIFCATDTKMAMFFSGNKYEEIESVEANGLFGNLTEDPIIINETGSTYKSGIFFVLQQKLYECGWNCTVGVNRGWLEAEKIENKTTPSSAPRRVIGNPNGTPTGIHNLNADGFKNIEGARKYFYNNNIVIVNEGRIYNAQGILIQ